MKVCRRILALTLSLLMILGAAPVMAAEQMVTTISAPVSATGYADGHDPFRTAAIRSATLRAACPLSQVPKKSSTARQLAAASMGPFIAQRVRPCWMPV